MGGELKEIMAKAHRPNVKVINSTDAKKLVADVISMVEKDKISEK